MSTPSSDSPDQSNYTDAQRPVIGTQQVSHAVASLHPQQVHQLTDHLYRWFTVEGGTQQLSGCSLDDVPFFVATLESETGPQAKWFDADGAEIELAIVDRLQLEQRHAIAGPPSQWRPSEFAAQWLPIIDLIILNMRDRGETLQALEMVWCKKATGKLTFKINHQSVDYAFCGWAYDLVTEQHKLQPYTCPITNKASFRLAATDNGRISVAEAIHASAISGKRFLESEMVRCCATGAWALPDELHECPICEDQVIRSALRPCSECGQTVSSKQLNANQVCHLCASLEPIELSRSPWLTIAQRYPGLKKWSRHLGAVGRTTAVVQATNWTQKLRVTFELDGGKLIHARLATKLIGRWKDLADEEVERVLKPRS